MARDQQAIIQQTVLFLGLLNMISFYFPIDFPNSKIILYLNLLKELIILNSDIIIIKMQTHTPQQAGSIKIGGYMIIKNSPCKVTQFNLTGPRKNKATIAGTDIFTDIRYEQTLPVSATVLVPAVTYTEYQVADIDQEEFVSVILEDGNLKSNLKMPSDEKVYKEVRKCWDQNHENNAVFVSIQASCGTEKIISAKVKLQES